MTGAIGIRRSLHISTAPQVVYEGWDEKLAGVDAEQLRQQLRTETDPKAVKRLVVSQSPLDFASGSLDCEVTGHGCFVDRLRIVEERSVVIWIGVLHESELKQCL